MQMNGENLVNHWLEAMEDSKITPRFEILVVPGRLMAL